MVEGCTAEPRSDAVLAGVLSFAVLSFPFCGNLESFCFDLNLKKITLGSFWDLPLGTSTNSNAPLDSPFRHARKRGTEHSKNPQAARGIPRDPLEIYSKVDLALFLPASLGGLSVASTPPFLLANDFCM